jgi:hypothetical protein
MLYNLRLVGLKVSPQWFGNLWFTSPGIEIIYISNSLISPIDHLSSPNTSVPHEYQHRE